MSKKYRVGILSDSPFLPTGYSNQATHIANSLASAGHQVIYFGHGFQGQTISPPIRFTDGKTLNFSVVGGGRMAYFQDLLQIYVKQYKIDVLIILLDTFMLFGQDGWFLKLDLSPARTIFYYPSDGGGGLPRNCENIIAKVDVGVAMARFGQKQVKDMYGIDTKHIPHSINPSDIYPLTKEEKEELRRKWGLQGKFIVGTVARNQGRKMMDRTFKAFALFARENPDAILFVHSDPNDPAQVFSMIEVIKRYKLQNRVRFSGMTWYRGFDYSEMNNVYNLMDVFLLTTSGEGFGIPIIEAMSAEVPVLITDYTTTQELVLENNSGMGIDLVGTERVENPRVHEWEVLDGTIIGSWDVERGICSIKDCAKKLQILRDDGKMRETFGKNGRKAVLEKYNWNVTDPQWIELVEKLGGEY